MMDSQQVTELKKEVQKVARACDELKGTRERIMMANIQNRENLKQFRGLQNQLDQLNLDTTVGLENALVKAVVVHGKWEEEMYRHQRDLLHAVFERVLSNFDPFDVSVSFLFSE